MGSPFIIVDFGESHIQAKPSRQVVISVLKVDGAQLDKRFVIFHWCLFLLKLNICENMRYYCKCVPCKIVSNDLDALIHHVCWADEAVSNVVNVKSPRYVVPGPQLL